MALRKPVAEVEPLIRISDVLSEVAGQNPSRIFDQEAERVAATLPAKIISRDWSNRPCIPPMDATRLWQRMVRDRVEEDRLRMERLAEQEQENAGRVLGGAVMLQRPGEPDWIRPGYEAAPVVGHAGVSSGPGGG